MDLPRERQPSTPATGHAPAKVVPVDSSAAAADQDADLNIGEDVYRRSAESIPQGPPPRDRRRPALDNDLNPPPAEVKEVEQRKRKKNPLEKRNIAPLNEFKRVVRPQTTMAASAAVDNARSESPVSLDAVDSHAMEFGKVHKSSVTPDYRPNKLHGVLDSTYKHSRLRWLDWVDRVGPHAIIGVVVVVLGGGFLVWRYFGSLGNEAATLPGESAVTGLSPDERIARGKKTVEQFIQAQTNEARLPLVMDPERARSRMAQFYGDMGGQNPNITTWEVGAPVGSKNGEWLPFHFTDTAGRKITVPLGETATGCILDWENFVAYGDMPWQEFCRAKPASSQALRVRLRRTERYQSTYTKETWQSWDVEHRTGGPALTAYSNRTGRAAEDLEALVKGDHWQSALVFLHFDPAAPSEGIVIIEGVTRSRWQDEATSWTGP